MSGRELQDYLMESGLFKVDIPCYMIEIDESSKVFNKVSTKYKGFAGGRVEVDIVRHKHGEQEQWVEFTFGGFNLFVLQNSVNSFGYSLGISSIKFTSINSISMIGYPILFAAHSVLFSQSYSK